eukprot:scaffold7529_cov153-Skeletonema_marinoi.AAC.1
MGNGDKGHVSFTTLIVSATTELAVAYRPAPGPFGSEGLQKGLGFLSPARSEDVALLKSTFGSEGATKIRLLIESLPCRDKYVPKWDKLTLYKSTID